MTPNGRLRPAPFVAERHLPVVTVTLDLDGQSDRLAGLDRELERSWPDALIGRGPPSAGPMATRSLGPGAELDGPQVVDRCVTSRSAMRAVRRDLARLGRGRCRRRLHRLGFDDPERLELARLR